MRDVEWGWLIRYMHSTGASMFFVVVYLHMFRGLMYGSYRKPRELTWIFGMPHLPVLMARRSSATCSRGARCRTGARR
jgi:ubiquinol-cytochrome c reductase cytochrome b subunit